MVISLVDAIVACLRRENVPLKAWEIARFDGLDRTSVFRTLEQMSMRADPQVRQNDIGYWELCEEGWGE